MKKKLISIIIPVYNVENYLKKCINSVINQTYSNLEIILVDDGSIDNSGKICDEYKKKDKRIKVIHKKNGGLSDARNAGLDIAKGDYITFVDSDDFINSIMIEDFYNAISKNDCDIVFGKIKDYYSFNFEGEIVNNNKENIEIKTKEECLKNINITIYNRVCAKLFKSTIFTKLRFPKGLNYEDSYISPYIYDIIKKVTILPYNYYYRFVREDSIVHAQFSKKDYDLITVGEARIKFYQEKNNKDDVILAHKFYMSNVINLYKKAYKATVDTKIKKEILCKYKEKFNTIKKDLSLMDKIKYKSFTICPNLIVKLYIMKGN